MTTHYEMTLEERLAVGGYVCASDNAAQPEMICRTGDGHAVGARDWSKVDCQHCLSRAPATAKTLTTTPITRNGKPGEDVTTKGETWFHPYACGAPFKVGG